MWRLVVVAAWAAVVGCQGANRTTGCGGCRMREELRSRNLDIIKNEVLRKMGFANAPNITGKALPDIPPHLFDKIEDRLGGDFQSDQPTHKTGYSVSEEDDDYHIKTNKVFSFAQPYPRLRHSWKGHDILHFPLSDAITKYRVANATLNIFIKGVEKRPLPMVLIEVFKVQKLPEQHQEAPVLKRVFSKRITQPFGRGDWIHVHFTETVSEWFKSSRENLGFVVNATANGKKVAVTETGDKSKVPYVEIATTEGKRRVRRNIGLDCDDSMNESICCRYPLVVNFEEFGWDFIIAPKKYDAHYCSGECPYVTLQRYPHTHLAKMALQSSAAQPCCAPRKMSAISMLYFDVQLNIVHGDLPGMVVDRCGCA